MALIGPFFGVLIGAEVQPNASTARQNTEYIIGGAAGVVLGVLIGAMQLKRGWPGRKNLERFVDAPLSFFEGLLGYA